MHEIVRFIFDQIKKQTFLIEPTKCTHVQLWSRQHGERPDLIKAWQNNQMKSLVNMQRVLSKLGYEIKIVKKNES